MKQFKHRNGDTKSDLEIREQHIREELHEHRAKLAEAMIKIRPLQEQVESLESALANTMCRLAVIDQEIYNRKLKA